MQRRRGRRVITWILASLGALLVLGAVGIVIWSQVGVMAAEKQPLAEVRENPDLVIEDAAERIVLSPAEGGSNTGFVFVPGAKVDPWAYAAILQDIVTTEGVTVVITRPWLNLAFFDPRGLDAFTSAAPDVDTWMVGGHSLGGVRACQLATDADALVLFASYCATDVSDTDLPVLSIGGSEDGLSTPAKIADARPLLPEDADILEIEGAAHASFGDYGPQSGDGDPTISREAMRAEVTTALDGFVDRVTAD